MHPVTVPAGHENSKSLDGEDIGIKGNKWWVS